MLLVVAPDLRAHLGEPRRPATSCPRRSASKRFADKNTDDAAKSAAQGQVYTVDLRLGATRSKIEGADESLLIARRAQTRLQKCCSEVDDLTAGAHNTINGYPCVRVIRVRAASPCTAAAEQGPLANLSRRRCVPSMSSRRDPPTLIGAVNREDAHKGALDMDGRCETSRSTTVDGVPADITD